MPFIQASRRHTWLRMAICSPSGGGKTWTALTIAAYFQKKLGGNIYVICAEKGSAHIYSTHFPKYYVDAFEDVDMRDYGPLVYSRKIEEVERQPEPTIMLIDGISPAWSGTGGALELVDKAAMQGKGNPYAAWRGVTPQHNALVDHMLRTPMHLIVTMRMKDEYVLEENSKGKQVPRKIGTEVIQRSGIEYEFSVVGEMSNADHSMWFTKSRCKELDGRTFYKPGDDLAAILFDWCQEAPIVSPEEPTKSPTVSSKKPPIPQETVPSKKEPPNALTVQELLNCIPAGLERRGVPHEDAADATEAAHLCIRDVFNVDRPEDVPESEVDKLREYMNGDMLVRLKTFIKEEAA